MASTNNNNPNVTSTNRDIDAENADFWRENGMCPKCGAHTYHIAFSGDHKIFQPLTVAGEVNRGRCLHCFPVANTLPLSHHSVNYESDPPRASAAETPQVNPETVNSAGPVQVPPSPEVPAAAILPCEVPSERSRTRASSRVASVPKLEESNSDGVLSDDSERGNQTKKPAAPKRAASKKQEAKKPSTPKKKKSRTSSTEVLVRDYEGSDFIGYLTSGTIDKGEGRFEHLHEDDYEAVNGKITIYEGEIRNGKLEGRGKMVNANGAVYEGPFKNGGFNGYGTCQFPGRGKWRYTGFWVNDVMEGSGIHQQTVLERGQKQLQSYTGQWKAEKKHGEGKMTFPEGGYYEGEFKADEHDGKGKYVFKDDSVYEGEFKNGLRHGQGTMIYAEDGQKYVGRWKNNERNGMGKIEYRDGSQYKGTMKDDHRWNGTVFAPDGSEKEKYKNGKLQNVKV